MRHTVSQTVVIQNNYIMYIMLHKKKEKTLVCYYFFSYIFNHIVNNHEDKTIYNWHCRDYSDCPAS